MRVLDLFSGIGGFALGMEAAGHEVVAFCEIEPFCRRVLRRHWPKTPIYEDIRTLTTKRLTNDGIKNIEIITGGFPCQDISRANRAGKGMHGEKSGPMWREYARLIRELRPHYAVVENPPGLVVRGGIGDVLRDLHESGYDAIWQAFRASDHPAPHTRERIFIVGHPNSDGWQGAEVFLKRQFGIAGTSFEPLGSHQWAAGVVTEGADGISRLVPPIPMLDHGLPHRLDGLKAVGNAVVPQIAAMIGRELQ